MGHLDFNSNYRIIARRETAIPFRALRTPDSDEWLAACQGAFDDEMKQAEACLIPGVIAVIRNEDAWAKRGLTPSDRVAFLHLD